MPRADWVNSRTAAAGFLQTGGLALGARSKVRCRRRDLARAAAHGLRGSGNLTHEIGHAGECVVEICTQTFVIAGKRLIDRSGQAPILERREPFAQGPDHLLLNRHLALALGPAALRDTLLDRGERSTDLAHFVGQVLAGNGAIEIAAGHILHRLGQPDQRIGQAVAKQQDDCQSHRDDKADQGLRNMRGPRHEQRTFIARLFRQNGVVIDFIRQRLGKRCADRGDLGLHHALGLVGLTDRKIDHGAGLDLVRAP